MAVSFSHLSTPFWPYSTPTPRLPHSAFTFPVVANSYEGGGDVSFCLRFCGLKRWMLKRIKLSQPNTEFELVKQFKTIKNQKSSNDADEAIKASSKAEHRVSKNASAFVDSSPSVPQTHSFDFSAEAGGEPSLCIAVIVATGELARGKNFPALFALYYSGFLPEDVGIFGYSRKDLTDEDLRSIIASTLTCRIDHQYGSLFAFQILFI